MTAAAGPAEPRVEIQEPPEEGQRFALLAALFDSWVTIAAAGFIVLILVLAVIGEAVAPDGANEINVMNQLQPPSLTHFFGTDDLGRDVFSRVIIAARPSVMVSIVSVVSVTLTRLTMTEGRAAMMTRLKTSRPRSSVPKRWVGLGGCSWFMTLISFAP